MMVYISGCCSCILVLGLLLSTSNAAPSFSVQLAEGDIRFDFYAALEPEDCFLSPCTTDLNTQFYVTGMFPDSDPCEFASMVRDSPVSEPFLEATNETSVSVGMVPFFKTVFGTSSCRRGLTNLAKEAALIFESTGFTKVIVSVIESSEAFDFESSGLMCNIPCIEEEKAVRVNFVIPSFCGSSCVAESDCQGRDVGMEKWELDNAIAQYELSELLYNWNAYLEILDEELAYLEENLNEEDSDVDWKNVLDIHTKANDCLIGGIEGVSSEEARYGSLMWALEQITENAMK